MSHSITAARERVAALCRHGLDSRTLRVEVLAEIRRSVPFDAYAWLLTDPETRVGSAPLASVPDLAGLPQLIRVKYGTKINRWTTLAANSCATLVQATAAELSRSRFWRDQLAGHGVTDVASMVFRDQHGCWGFLDLWRCGGAAAQAQFSTLEQAFLASLGAGLTTALRACQAATFSQPGTPAASFEAPAVLLLSSRLKVIDQTPQADTHLRTLLPTESQASPVAAAAYNVAAQLLAVEDGVDDAPAQARTHLTGTRWLSLRAARLGGVGQRATIVVTVEPILPLERLDLYARTAGLSHRETELLHRLARGSSTHQLATEMTLSQHTVQDHLKSVFAKTNTNSRGTLIACALGPEPRR
ncbi:MAG: helix-turn-helix transcriptional regulator [Actinomycetota bacterium]|nr:helix-turn-helix transcriptional regulator [Actinomycetota bacterium]